jgi:hypothetical protein
MPAASHALEEVIPAKKNSIVSLPWEFGTQACDGLDWDLFSTFSWTCEKGHSKAMVSIARETLVKMDKST